MKAPGNPFLTSLFSCLLLCPCFATADEYSGMVDDANAKLDSARQELARMREECQCDVISGDNGMPTGWRCKCGHVQEFNATSESSMQSASAAFGEHLCACRKIGCPECFYSVEYVGNEEHGKGGGPYGPYSPEQCEKERAKTAGTWEKFNEQSVKFGDGTDHGTVTECECKGGGMGAGGSGNGGAGGGGSGSKDPVDAHLDMSGEQSKERVEQITKDTQRRDESVKSSGSAVTDSVTGQKHSYGGGKVRKPGKGDDFGGMSSGSGQDKSHFKRRKIPSLDLND